MAFPTSPLGSSMVIHYVPVSGHRASAIVSDLGYMSSSAAVPLWIADRVVGAVQRLERLVLASWEGVRSQRWAASAVSTLVGGKPHGVGRARVSLLVIVS